MIRVQIVDDHKLVVEGLEKFINESEIAQVSGKAYSVAGCWQILKAEQPQVLLLDISLPDGSGIDLCPQIKARYPAVNILMLTSYSDHTIITHLLGNGASGYVLKNAMPEEVIEGITTVASGKQFLCEEVDLLLKNHNSKPLELTRRECELLRLIVEDYSNIEIADKMCLGYETIKSYRKNLYVKLNAHNTGQLVKKALALKLV
ncbi:MAG: response regulator transcription factor [Candidatus Symbiothrix sp.]|jgi:DNA-binding NarL/FixJ family response regulator|nr:response regulator transcription factor [Candidatus Symbiothrix sp.]